MSTKKKTSTGLERQHAYKSFKERVDSLKIEPARKLSARASDYVETSHFLVTLEHWKEVNVSGNFTDFLYEVEKNCQTLPQILHHQKSIFTSLEKHIRVMDVNSLQPLLELVAQFIHDLGPDFMEFYDQFLILIIDISQKINPNDSQNIKNSSNVLEWTFNALAYAFKYLSRTLVADLKPTFRRLLPVFEMTKKTYVARFCAEAVSFLVKKLKPEALHLLVNVTFNENKTILEENHAYRDAMVVLFSESMKNTQNTFHSKSAAVFELLLQNALAEDRDNDSCIDALCDILLKIIDHGSIDACLKFYSSALSHLGSVAKSNTSMKRLGYVSQVLTALCFAESGQKIQDWSMVFNVVQAITDNFDVLSSTTTESTFSAGSSAVLASISCLFATITRNCPVSHLTKEFSSMADYLSLKNDGEFYISFYEMLIVNSKEKILGFGGTQVLQAVLNNASSEKILSRLALSLTKIETLYPQITTDISLPRHVSSQLLESLNAEIDILENKELLKIHWKVYLLLFCSDLQDTNDVLLPLLTKLCLQKEAEPCFLHDVIGITLVVVVRCLARNLERIEQLFGLILDNLATCRQSLSFLNGCNTLFEKVPETFKSTLLTRKELFLTSLGHTLALPDVRVRRATAELMSKFYKAIDEPVSFIVAQAGIIDNVPLSVDNVNDIKMRIRVMFNDYTKQQKLTLVDHLQLAQYTVGLLTNSFQPCWQAVNDNISKISGLNCLAELWTAFFSVFSQNFSTEKQPYWRSDALFASTENPFVGEFRSSNERFAKYFDLISTTIVTSIEDIEYDLYEHVINTRPTVSYNPMIRSRILLALASIPSAAERHGAQLIDFLLELQDEDEKHSWNSKDRLLLISIFSKFKKISKISNSNLLYNAMMKQLLSKDVPTQKAALSVLFAWNKLEINKYRDNLSNLLDDKLFRDELQSLVSKSSELKIEDSDRDAVVPIVLRLLYGRAKGVTNNNSKNGRKFAIASVLPNLPDEYISLFLKITAENFPIGEFFETEMVQIPTQMDLRAMVGYLNMLYEVYVGLGYKFAHVLTETIQPLLFTLINAQHVLDEPIDDEIAMKTAKSVRQLGFKCLNHLFKVTSKTYNWKGEAPMVYERVIKPRLVHFGSENAQQPSSMMQMMLSWISAPELVSLYYFDDFAPVHALVSLLSNPFAKDTVKSALLDFCIACFTQKDVHDDQFYSVLALLVDGLLGVLPTIIQSSEDKDINSRAATLLLLIIEGKYVELHATKGELIASCSHALDKPATQIGISDKISILLSLASVVEEYDCTFADLNGLYETCSRSLRIYKDRNMRSALIKVFNVFGSKFEYLLEISEILEALNSYSERRIMEPDFEKRMAAYRKLNEDLYPHLTVLQWTPIIYSNLFFINDPDEISLRSNAAHTLTRFIDCLNARMDPEEYVQFWRSVVVSYLRAGLKKDTEEVRDGYINVLAHTVRHSEHIPEMESMKVLLSDDPDLDFFVNFNHVQLSHRQKAIKTLNEHRNDISADCLYHYLLPMTEVYAVCQGERFLPLWNDVNDNWQTLASCLNWRDFRQLFRKHISASSRATETELRDRCRLVVSLSRALKLAFDSISNSTTEEEEFEIEAGKEEIKRESESESDHQIDTFKNLPENLESVHSQIMDEFLAPIMKIVKIRDDETIVQRAPLVEAAVNCLLCVSDSVAEASIAGVLTSTCQALRSRTQHIRDAIRKSLCRVARVLGAKYFQYIVKELKTALSRGAQIHTLSYTLYSILNSVRDLFKTGDLDESAVLIVDIIMEDIFGAAGQEKDAEGYVSKMIEVKSKMSYESAQLLTSNINFNRFRAIVNPLKLLMRENLPMKTKKNLDELIRRYAVGLNYNTNSSKMEVLILCFELLKQSKSTDDMPKPKAKKSVAEDHFLVDLEAKPVRMAKDNTQIMYTLQTLSYELMRTALGKHKSLMTIGNLDGFFPQFEESIDLENESTLCALYRVLNLIITLPFSDEKDAFFEKAALKAFKVIQDLPTTASQISQIMLKFLAAIIRHKPSIQLNNSSITYILVRIMPDLEEPHRQSLAFNFMKAVLLQHIMLPEIYDVFEKVSNIMVLNHTLEIRAMSRGLYYQFLMEYEHGAKKLEKSFKFLVNNLAYPTEDGRLSVMEFMHTIVLKATSSLLDQLSVSFFVGLANVLVTDDSSRCREMASELLGHIFRKSKTSKMLSSMEDLTLSWLTNHSNNLLQRCGLMVYKVYVSELNYGNCPKLDKAAYAVISECIKRAKNDSSDVSTSWEEVYTSMNVWAVLCKQQQDEILGAKHKDVWKDLFETLLYPHTWVRLLSSRLVGTLLSNLDSVGFDVSPHRIQTIAYRLLRQLAAPTVSSELGTQVVKNMILIITKWEQTDAAYISSKALEKDGEEEAPRYEKATDFAVDRICKIMRQERKPNTSITSSSALTASIQLAAMISQILTSERLKEVATKIIMGLYMIVENKAYTPEETEILNLGNECLKILETKLGTTLYNEAYMEVRMQVDRRREQRRADKAALALNEPEVAAMRKLKKHERFREKRRHPRDDSGFYRSKKRQPPR